MRGYAKYLAVDSVEASTQMLRNAGWEVEPTRGDLVKKYEFPGFRNAWAFLTEVAMHSHLKGHHPRIVNHYNWVEISLYTDDISALSQHDIKMAEKFDEFASKYYNK